jgi:hypothetical protein
MEITIHCPWRKMTIIIPPLRDKMAKIIIGCTAASIAALIALRFCTEVIIGELEACCRRRAVTNQL